MSFPLGDWIDEHLDVPFMLGQSGMAGSLESTPRILAEPRNGAADPASLRRRIAERLDVDARRVFLTHGATEGNALVVFYLAGRIRSAEGRAPRGWAMAPEYPPLREVADAAGFGLGPAGRPDLWIRSEPNNPTGLRCAPSDRESVSRGAPRWLLDETFREFTGAASAAALGRRGLWTTGTLTKVFGADEVRVGWIVAPEEEVENFGRFHPIASDKVPIASVRAALDLLDEAKTVLAEARRIFEANRRVLEAGLGASARVEAPLVFDRPGPTDTDDLALRCLAGGVLVCPGRFFDDPSGVRLALTRRNFPEALAAYRSVREAATPEAARSAPRPPRGAPTGASPSGRAGPRAAARGARAERSGRSGRPAPGPTR